LTDHDFNPPSIAVTAETGDDLVRLTAVSLARELGLPFLDGEPTAATGRPDLLLVQTTERLELRETRRGAPRPIYVDFVGGPLGYRRLSGRSRRQPIAQAVGLRSGPVTVVDATAGLARDSFLLACLGCTVTAIERSPVLAALVRDGIIRAEHHSPQLDAVLARFKLILGDARNVLRSMTGSDAPDAIYLDPMYPPGKKAALVKKEMRVCRRLVGDDPDAGELFEAACRVARKRVVVKRQLHAPPLGPKPTTTHRGTRVRYDVYVMPR
jgi:16S rRNA (guanine1516-N2)-methyltransferase